MQDIDFALSQCKGEERKLFNSSEELTLPESVPQNASEFVRSVMLHVLKHPDVQIALRGKNTHNLLWHLQRTKLAEYLHFVEEKVPQFAALLEIGVNHWGDKSNPTDGESVICFLANLPSQALTIQKILDKTIILHQRRFFTYILSMKGYPDHFHCGKSNWSNHLRLLPGQQE